MDLFAIKDNAMCLNFCSGERMNPGLLPEAFLLQWSPDLLCAFPVIPRVIAKARRDRVTLILINPYMWGTFGWQTCYNCPYWSDSQTTQTCCCKIKVKYTIQTWSRCTLWLGRCLSTLEKDCALNIQEILTQSRKFLPMEKILNTASSMWPTPNEDPGISLHCN